MKEEIILSKDATNTLYALICKVIEEENNFPEHDNDEWMNHMLEVQTAIGEADRIVIGE